MTELTMFQRITRTLRDGPARGQTELIRRVLGDTYTLEDVNLFRESLALHLQAPPTVREERIQVPGTGHEGPPVYEYIYSNQEGIL